MASQKVTILAVGGKLGGEIWSQTQRWSNQRATDDPNEWSPQQWALDVRQQIDLLVDRILPEAFAPPVLYWSQHVDLWSMGDVFQHAMDIGSGSSITLLTDRFEIYLCQVRIGDKVPSNVNQADEYRRLEARLSEAISAWAELAADRVVILIRETFDSLVTDDEVAASLKETPKWWPFS